MEPDKQKRGRKSKLTDAQREDIRKRLLDGEKSTALGREYGVDEKVIRRIKSEASIQGGKPRVPVEDIDRLARKSIERDLADPELRDSLEKMGIEDRGLFHSRKANLIEITLQLSMSAQYAAQNAHKLSRMAQSHLETLDEANPDPTTLMQAMQLQSASNECAKQPMKLFEIATKQPPPPPEDKPLRIIGGLPDVPYE